MSFLDLTLADLDRIEQAVGSQLDPAKGMTAKAMRAVLVSAMSKSAPVAEAERIVGGMSVSEAAEAVATADLPAYYEGGLPVGGRTADVFVVACAKAFQWPPDVTRRQTLRDLRLVLDSLEAQS